MGFANMGIALSLSLVASTTQGKRAAANAVMGPLSVLLPFTRLSTRGNQPAVGEIGGEAAANLAWNDPQAMQWVQHKHVHASYHTQQIFPSEITMLREKKGHESVGCVDDAQRKTKSPRGETADKASKATARDLSSRDSSTSQHLSSAVFFTPQLTIKNVGGNSLKPASVLRPGLFGLLNRRGAGGGRMLTGSRAQNLSSPMKTSPSAQGVVQNGLAERRKGKDKDEGKDKVKATEGSSFVSHRAIAGEGQANGYQNNVHWHLRHTQILNQLPMMQLLGRHGPRVESGGLPDADQRTPGLPEMAEPADNTLPNGGSRSLAHPVEKLAPPRHFGQSDHFKQRTMHSIEPIVRRMEARLESKIKQTLKEQTRRLAPIQQSIDSVNTRLRPDQFINDEMVRLILHKLRMQLREERSRMGIVQ